MKEQILIIGSNGQIGTELAHALRSKYGSASVITSDLKPSINKTKEEIFEELDVLDINKVESIFEKYKPTQIYLLAAMLSATGEKYPRKAWDLNMDGLLNILDLSIKYGVQKVFWPSSIAVFGPNSPNINTPQYTVMDPNTIYGISKLAGERLCEYYFNTKDLDVRSIRYPGLISWKTLPGGGTTDYAVDIFHSALKKGEYECFLSENTALPMLYMDDAIRATLELMDAPKENIKIRSSYNLGGLSFTPKELAAEIKKDIPDFKISYLENDPRQKIADSWPSSIDDSIATQDWNWKPQFTIATMVKDMLTNLKNQ